MRETTPIPTLVFLHGKQNKALFAAVTQTHVLKHITLKCPHDFLVHLAQARSAVSSDTQGQTLLSEWFATCGFLVPLEPSAKCRNGWPPLLHLSACDIILSDAHTGESLTFALAFRMGKQRHRDSQRSNSEHLEG